MRRMLSILGLFAFTVVIVAAYLVGRIGLSRIVGAETACPQTTDPDYSRPFLPDHEIPNLCAATRMSPAQGVIYILRRSIPVRTYVASEIVQDCKNTQPGPCAMHLGDVALESAIDSRLDAILPRRIRDSHDFTSADLATTLPFPWSGFTAMRSDHSPFAALSFELPNGTPFTLLRVEQQYGVAQQRQADAQGYLSLEYPGTESGYRSKITVLVNPITTEVRRIMVSVTRE